MDGTGSEDKSISKQPDIQQTFSIGDIFKSIQQKIRDTKTQNSDDCVSGANPAQVSESCEENSEATSPASEPFNCTSTINSVTSSAQDNRSSSEISLASASGSELEPRNDSTTVETSVSGHLAGLVHVPVEPAADLEAYTGGIAQSLSSTGSDEQATPEKDAPQEQQNGIVHIKEEKEDAGYTHNHCHHDSNSIREEGVTYPEMREVKIEPFTLKVMEHDEDPEQGNDPDVIFHGVSYRDPGDSSSESDSDSSMPSFATEPAPEMVEEVAVPRSKGEVMPEELPPLENLHISLPEETKLELLGVVSGIVGVLVIIDSEADLKQYSPLNDDTVLFLEDRQPFGVVFEVFGPCMAPSYSVRFNSAADIQEKGIEIGLKIYFVPDPVPEVGEITHYVFVQKLKRIKGSDASWKDNNEPPEDHLEFSDDDEEKRFKAKRKAERRNKGTAEPEKRGNDEEQKGKRGKKHPSSADEGALSSSAHGRAYNSGLGRNKQSNGDSHSQPSSSFGSGHRGFRRDFSLSKPVFTAPENQTRPPRHRNPPGSQSSMGPQACAPRGGAFENRWSRGPFSGSPAEGSFSGDPVRPFPDGRGNGRSIGAPVMPGPSPSQGRGGPFGGAPVRPPFPDGPGPFPGEPGTPSTSHNFWRPPNSVSGFPLDTSVPPPNFPSFPAGQVNPQQAHPPPPPPPWHPPQPPSFGPVTGIVPPSPSHGSSGAQPHGFDSDRGPAGPPCQGFDAGRQRPARFQGQPQFVRYHHPQGHNWQPKE